LTELASESLTEKSIDRIYERLIQDIVNTKVQSQRGENDAKMSTTKIKRSRKARDKPLNRAQKRRYAFAKCQELINKCPKKLADVVAANDLSLMQVRQVSSKDDTRNLYTNLWGVPGPEQETLYQESPTVAIGWIFTPILPVEVENKLKKIPNSSAAGVDGLSKMELKKKGISIMLAKLFNVLLLKQIYPSAWKQNRTTLIPKAGKDTNDITNWRPITI